MRAICSLPVPGKWSLTPVSPRIPSGNWTDARASCRRDIRRMGIRITRCSSPSTWLVCRCFTCWTLSFQLFWCSCYQVCLNILLQCFTNQKKNKSAFFTCPLIPVRKWRCQFQFCLVKLCSCFLSPKSCPKRQYRCRSLPSIFFLQCQWWPCR